MESDYHWLVTVGLVTSSVIAVTANAFLLYVFAKKRSLRTIPNRFVINLLLTNLLSSLLLIPLLVVDQGLVSTVRNSTSENQTIESIEEGVLIQEEIFSSNRSLKIVETREKFLKQSVEEKLVSNVTILGGSNDELLCYFAQASTSFVCTASICSILLIGINQYFGVIHSLRYHFYINKCRATIFILSSWIAALICAILSSVTYSDSSLWHFCSKRGAESSASKALNTVYAFTYFFVVILAPFMAICVIYLCIYAAAHQNSERMRKSTSASSNAPLDIIPVEPLEHSPSPTGRASCSIPRVHSAPNFSALEDSRENYIDSDANRVKRTSSSDRNNFITNLKHKISNASVFRYREETRAAKISVLVIFMVLICYVPYGLTLVLTSGCIRISPGQIFNYLSLVLLVFSNIISPFLFGYRNKRVKREIGKMLGLVPPSASLQTFPNIEAYRRQSSIIRNRSFQGIYDGTDNSQPLLSSSIRVPEVIVTCKVENEKKSILKRVGSGWQSYKKCNFITVPESCLGDARGSFSSASTQVSNDEE